MLKKFKSLNKAIEIITKMIKDVSHNPTKKELMILIDQINQELERIK